MELGRRLYKFGARIARNRKSVWRDVSLAARHVHTLPGILLPINSDPTVASELDVRNYNSWWDIATVAGQVFVPAERHSCSLGIWSCQPQHYPRREESSRWFFINGIATSPPLAMMNAREIARIFNRPVHLLHTPTYGAVWDFIDSLTARTLRKDGKLSRPAFQVVKRALQTCDKVVIVGHSQGTIVSSYIVRKVLKHPQTRDLAHKLEVYTVAGVADSLHVDKELSEKHGRPVPYVEHFSNGDDFFARIGVLAHRESTAGALFNIEGKSGHLLNDHYLGAIERGEYCGGTSRLFHYVHGKDPGNYWVDRDGKVLHARPALTLAANNVQAQGS